MRRLKSWIASPCWITFVIVMWTLVGIAVALLVALDGYLKAPPSLAVGCC